MGTYCPVCRTLLSPPAGEPDGFFRPVSDPPVTVQGWDKEAGTALYEAVGGWDSCERRLGAAREEIEKWISWYEEINEYIPDRIRWKFNGKKPDSRALLTYLEQTENQFGIWMLKKNLWIW